MAPSRVIRRAMMSPMSPLPRITARRPTIFPSMLMNRWAAPAVRMPEHRVPGTEMAPRVRSRQPMARTTAPDRTVWQPPSGLTYRTVLSGETDRTMASVFT